MNQVILWIMAAGVVLGGIDRIFGSPKGYGKKFEEGFFFFHGRYDLLGACIGEDAWQAHHTGLRPAGR